MTKTIVFGKIVEKKYKLSTNLITTEDLEGNEISYYKRKPYITFDYITKEWVEICSYDGSPKFSAGVKFNISESESIVASETIFRADLNEFHLRTNKVVEEREIDKEKVKRALSKEIKKYNAATIENDEKLKAYCDLHKLKYEETDPDELIKILPITTTVRCVQTNPALYGEFNELYSKPITYSLPNAKIF